MKKLKRLTLGVISSFLFTVGLSHAADRIDPMSKSLTGLDEKGSTLVAAPDTSTYCDVYDKHL